PGVYRRALLLRRRPRLGLRGRGDGRMDPLGAPPGSAAAGTVGARSFGIAGWSLLQTKAALQADRGGTACIGQVEADLQVAPARSALRGDEPAAGLGEGDGHAFPGALAHRVGVAGEDALSGAQD